MAGKIIQHKNELLNAAVYVDYENIFELLKRYGVDPLQINFFPMIINKLKNEYGLNLIEFIAYGNYEKKTFQDKHQTALHNFGVDTRHTANNGKNCADLMLTVEALSTLYKNPSIDVFVIISSDRDMIPLLKAIKRETKLTCMFSTKYGFNASVTCFADSHEYLEDMFNLTPDMLLKVDETVEVFIFEENFNDHDVEKAREVSKLLYTSNVWKTYEKDGNPVTLKGYVKIISPKLGKGIEQTIKYFELAHHYHYITIYRDESKGLCLRKGDNYLEILGLMEL